MWLKWLPFYCEKQTGQVMVVNHTALRPAATHTHISPFYSPPTPRSPGGLVCPAHQHPLVVPNCTRNLIHYWVPSRPLPSDVQCPLPDAALLCCEDRAPALRGAGVRPHGTPPWLGKRDNYSGRARRSQAPSARGRHRGLG